MSNLIPEPNIFEFNNFTELRFETILEKCLNKSFKAIRFYIINRSAKEQRAPFIIPHNDFYDGTVDIKNKLLDIFCYNYYSGSIELIM